MKHYEKFQSEKTVYYQIRTYTKEYGWFREQRKCKTLEAAKSEALQFGGNLFCPDVYL